MQQNHLDRIRNFSLLLCKQKSSDPLGDLAAHLEIILRSSRALIAPANDLLALEWPWAGLSPEAAQVLLQAVALISPGTASDGLYTLVAQVAGEIALAKKPQEQDLLASVISKQLIVQAVARIEPGFFYSGTALRVFNLIEEDARFADAVIWVAMQQSHYKPPISRKIQAPSRGLHPGGIGYWFTHLYPHLSKLAIIPGGGDPNAIPSGTVGNILRFAEAHLTHLLAISGSNEARVGIEALMDLLEGIVILPNPTARSATTKPSGPAGDLKSRLVAIYRNVKAFMFGFEPVYIVTSPPSVLFDTLMPAAGSATNLLLKSEILDLLTFCVAGNPRGAKHPSFLDTWIDKYPGHLSESHALLSYLLKNEQRLSHVSFRHNTVWKQIRAGKLAETVGALGRANRLLLRSESKSARTHAARNTPLLEGLQKSLGSRSESGVFAWITWLVVVLAAVFAGYALVQVACAPGQTCPLPFDPHVHLEAARRAGVDAVREAEHAWTYKGVPAVLDLSQRLQDAGSDAWQKAGVAVEQGRQVVDRLVRDAGLGAVYAPYEPIVREYYTLVSEKAESAVQASREYGQIAAGRVSEAAETLLESEAYAQALNAGHEFVDGSKRFAHVAAREWHRAAEWSVHVGIPLLSEQAKLARKHAQTHAQTFSIVATERLKHAQIYLQKTAIPLAQKQFLYTVSEAQKQLVYAVGAAQSGALFVLQNVQAKSERAYAAVRDWIDESGLKRNPTIVSILESPVFSNAAELLAQTGETLQQGYDKAVDAAGDAADRVVAAVESWMASLK